MTAKTSAQTQPVLVFERMDPTDRSIAWLQEQGMQLTLGRAMWEAPYARYSDDEIVAAAHGHVAVMGASGARFTADVIDRLPALRFISKFGVGVDTIDIDAATRRGILVANTPEQLEVDDVAEHTIAMILAVAKSLTRWTPRYMRSGGWRPGPFAASLAGQTIGLVGLGHVGRAVASRLAAWKVKLLGFDPLAATSTAGVTLVDFDTLLRESNIVSLHASPTAANRHLINRAALSKMRAGSVLINTARASLVDTAALCDALRSGHLVGAGVDVFDEEPPDPAAALFTFENVVVTPHAAAWTNQGVENIGWHAARNLHAMLTGRGHADVVNRRNSATATIGSYT